MKRPTTDHRRNAWEKMRETGRRPTDARPACRRYLIVCEGEKTEPNYFKSLAETLDWDQVQVEVDPTGMNTQSLVERARKRKSEKNQLGVASFDEIWVVFDRDSFKSDQFDNAIKSADAAGMKAAWSNEAFELWYVLHFEFRNSGMSRRDYRRVLTRHLKQRYKKNDPEMYDKLEELGNQSLAIRYAKSLDKARIADKQPPSAANPCTLVYKLVERLQAFES
jgi:hypothetical protein